MSPANPSGCLKAANEAFEVEDWITARDEYQTCLDNFPVFSPGNAIAEAEKESIESKLEVCKANIA